MFLKKKKKRLTRSKPHDKKNSHTIPSVDEVCGLKTGTFRTADKNVNLVQPFRKTI